MSLLMIDQLPLTVCCFNDAVFAASCDLCLGSNVAVLLFFLSFIVESVDHISLLYSVPGLIMGVVGK